jgi:hypothetical protein
LFVIVSGKLILLTALLGGPSLLAVLSAISRMSAQIETREPFAF